MGLPVEVNNLMMGSLGGYTVGRSLRFRSSASAYLNRTPASAGNRKTWTWSGWVKRGIVSNADRMLFSAANGANRDYICFYSNDQLTIDLRDAIDGRKTSTQVFRDPSAWYHIVVAFDTTQATADNRIKLYVNGTQITAFANNSAPTQNYDGAINNTVSHTINAAASATAWYNDGYLAEVNFIDGQALTPTSFGAYDTNGVWQPKKYIGTYGTNGFYLNFSDNSASTATAIGKDLSGNGNNWTPNNISLALNTNVTSFTSVGTTSWTAPVGVTSVDYLIVAGGGGGGGSSPNYVGGGGGGGGGVLTGTLPVTAGTSYTVTVGAGGAAGAGSLGGNGGNGGNSIFATLTAIGGGGGGAYSAGPSTGGSGGGGANNGAGQTGAAGTSGQGNAGGNAGTYFNSTSSQGGGGGGGAGATGSNFNGLNGGAGGAGIASTITGSTVYYGGGGGGGAANGTGGAAGSGGGGAGGSGGNSAGGNAVANRGGGGGGASTQLSGSPTGGAGGSGIVIISYVLGGTATTYDSMIDSPTNAAGTSTGIGNYAVLNVIDKSSSFTLTNGNLSSSVATTWQNARATFGITSGKWYWEYTMTATGLTMLGVGTSSVPLTGGAYLNAGFYGYYSFDGSKWNNNTNTSYGNTFTTNDVVGIAFDADSGKIWFSKNGTWQASGDPVAGTNAAYSGLTAIPYFPTVSLDNSQGANGGAINFGQRSFTYTPPSGYKALNTYNLPAPSIANGAQYMATTLWTGDGTNGRSITNTNNGFSFAPDLVWVKSRSNAYYNMFQDTVRGAGKSIFSNVADAESGNSGDLIGAFQSNGFTVNLNYTSQTTNPTTNGSAATYVAWQWKGGGTAVTNNSGTITSQVSANPSAGCSIITYTGTGATGSAGHGLGVTPAMVIYKSRSAVSPNSSWIVWHKATSQAIHNSSTIGISGFTGAYVLNLTNSVLTYGFDEQMGQSGKNYVAYCFAEVAGFSKFGIYTGNGSADGPFIYTGFRPRWIMWKASSIAGQWFIHDTARSTYNYSDLELAAETSAAEYSANGAGAGQRMDILSNGFKVRTTNNANNQSGATYIYAAFAENPFNSSRAR